MCSLCRLPVATHHNFGQFWTFGGLLYRPPFTAEGQIWCAGADHRSRLTRLLCRLPVATNHSFCNFDFWGLPFRPSFTDEGQMWCTIADPWCTLTCQSSSRSVYSVALSWRKTPIFAVFGLRHLVMSTVDGSLRMLNTGAQLETFPYPTTSKSFLGRWQDHFVHIIMTQKLQ